jgi:hypothetical protein
MRRPRMRIERFTSELPRDMQRAVRNFEMAHADKDGRLVINRVIFEGSIEPHEPKRPWGLSENLRILPD